MRQAGIEKKLALLLIFTVFLSGCYAYRFSRGKPPYDKGYVASRDDNTILEYTLGKDNTVPNVKLAKERFKRRRRTVEHYYKRMGYIDDYFMITFVNPITSIVRVAGGVFLLPYILVSDYRYEHDPEYRKRIIRIEEQKDALEEARINALKAQLREYIEEDLAVEEGKPIAKEKKKKEKPPKPPRVKKAKVKVTQEEPAKPVEPVEKAPEAVKEEPKVSEVAIPPAEQPIEAPKTEEPAKIEEPPEPEKQPKVVKEPEPVRVIKEKPAKIKKEPMRGELVAVITAKPARGISPLKVRFNANKSHSHKGRVVSYLWDFGDGDTSAKVNPTNIYWSGSYLPKEFTVTLTVTDDRGNKAQDTVIIEVANR